MAKLTAYGEQVIIELTLKSAEEVRASGFVLPKGSNGSIVNGKVQSVGADVEGISSGSEVLYDRGAGQEFVFDGKTYKVITADQVVAVIS